MTDAEFEQSCAEHQGLRDRITELERALAESQALNRRSLCVYCGHVETLEDPRDGWRDVMLRHIEACEKHPLRKMADQLTELEHALTPFANFADSIDPMEWDDSKVCFRCGKVLTAGHVRRAAEALKERP